MRRTILLMAALLCAPGCFVFDELDKGREIMEKHSPKKHEQAEPAPARPAPRGADEDEGLLAAVQGWWKEKKPAAQSSSGPPRDPDDVPVRCRSGGRTQFLRKSDCLVRGGTIL